ncbi:MAG: SGNH/GDSL hydrolase family protein [Proteiniphilum sp.]
MRTPLKNLTIVLFYIVSVLLFSSSSIPKTENSHDDKARVKAIIEGKERVNWVFTGNSITQGAKHTHGMRGYPEIFTERIRWELSRPYDFVINTAISGHTTQNILNDFEKRISRFNPKVVVLMIGTNDAAQNRGITVEKFGKNLEQIIDQVREIGAVPIILSPNTIIVEKSPERASLYLYVEKMDEVIASKNVIYVDNWSIWQSELQQKYNGDVFKELLNDPLHPNGYGHQEIAIALFKELSIFDPAAPTCGGEYYEGEH